MFGHRVSGIMVRSSFLLVFLLCMISCSSPLEKSVLSPLTSKELDKVAGEDASFLATYSIVEEKSNYIHTPADSARWKAITYKRLHSYITTIKSAELNSPLFTQLREKWEKIYNSNNYKVDSTISYWNNYLKTNSPDSLISIQYEGAETERIRNRNKQIDTLVKAKLRLKPLKFPIDSVKLLYSLASAEMSPIYYYPFNGELNHINYRKRLKDDVLVKVFPYLLPNIKKRVAEGDSSVLFQYTVHSVYSSGKCYSTDSLNKDLPKSVMQYNSSKAAAVDGQPFDELYYREKIIKELINPSFIPQSAYIKINAEQYYRQIDSLVFSYTNLNGE